MSFTGGQSPAEHHLGDRLAALVDGELGHDARERVLAHLATCGKCKDEADAQRELKSVFAESAPPGPSEGLLARLQGLPGGGADGPGSRLGAGAFGSGGLGGGDDAGRGGAGREGFGRSGFGRGGFRGTGFGTGGLRHTGFGSGAVGFAAEEDAYGFPPAGGPAMDGVPQQPRTRGFRIHETRRPAPPRRRFAFAAAGAVSLAAFALGGALPLEAAVDSPGGRIEGAGTSVTPLGARSTPSAARETAGREALLALGLQRARAATRGAGRTVTPAPSAMGLYGPPAPAVPTASPAPSSLVLPGRGIGLLPLTGPTGPSAVDRVRLAATDAPARLTAPLPPLPHPPLPLVRSTAPVPAGERAALAPRD
ncbi:zf-HC2 domain-containing protein [Streptomyces sp. NPDC003077]|uniref:zf-HC2 domain-containing protein n=1 Tax=Streptomyces sp. NPDC003077 TaxID=3154443 RepID=UPI0033BC0517